MSTTTLQDKAGNLAQRGLNAVQGAVHDGALQLRDQASDVTDTTVRYIQTEPFKAVLIAAATGAALMALVSMVSRSRGH